jgi:hypothetical protein
MSRLITTDDAKHLPPLHSTEKDPMAAQAIVRLHHIHGGLEWFITEYDQCDRAYGLIKTPDDTKLGFINITQLGVIDNGQFLVCRDPDFMPTPLYEILKVLIATAE